MASRRQAHCRRRAIHAAMRKGIVPQQEGGSSGGSSDSPKAQKAVQAQKARRG